jgi:hypothetical protein
MNSPKEIGTTKRILKMVSLPDDRVKSAAIVEFNNAGLMGVALSVHTKIGWWTDVYPTVLSAKKAFGHHFKPKAKWIEVKNLEDL